MTKLLGSSLAAARRNKSMSQEAVSKALGVSRAAVSQWESGVTSPSTENLIRICDLLGLNLSAATAGMVKVNSFVPLDQMDNDQAEVVQYVRDRRPEHRDVQDEFIRFLDGAPNDPVAPRDVPVYSCAYTGEEADFLRSDEIIDLVRRPQSYHRAGKPGAIYALYVVSPVLAPRYEEGELFYVQPGRPAAPGDYAVIKLKGGEADSQRWMMRRIVRRTDAGLKVASFQPASEIELLNTDIEAVHRIVPWGDLVDQ